MCKYVPPSKLRNGNYNNTNVLSKVLQALKRLEKKADEDYHHVQNRLDQLKEMESILNKLVITHLDSDEYVEYLFKRAEQLSTHLETYKKIIGKIDIGREILDDFKQISLQFIEYLKRKIEFKSTWIESMQTIESGRETIKEKLSKLHPIKLLVDDAYENDRYTELSDLKAKFDEELIDVNDLVDNCFQCGQHTKELNALLYDKLTELEVGFQRVVRESMNKINEIKCTCTQTSF